MFSITHTTIDGFEGLQLTDIDSGTEAFVVPACGALLHRFAVINHGVPVNIMESYNGPEDFRDHQESKGFRGAKLSPYVCRLAGGDYTFAVTAYHTGKHFNGPNAIHGLIYNAAFTVVSEDADTSHAQVKLLHAYRGEEEGYPFHYDCLVTYILEESNKLTVETTVINQDPGLIPITDGWHPYFRFGGNINDLQLECQTKSQVEFKEMIPTGKTMPYQELGNLQAIGSREFDDCFTLNFAECQPLVVLRDAVQQLQLEMYPDESYPYLQVYTPPDRKSLALENLSAAPDAFNNGMGLITLAAGESRNFKAAWIIKTLDRVL